MQVRTVKKLNYIPGIIFFLLVLLLSIVFVVLSIFVLNQKIPENYVKVDGEITSIQENIVFDDISYQVYIDYSYDGQDFSNKEYGKFDSFMKVGDKVTIYVNPDNPEEFMEEASDNFMFLIMSGVFFAIGIGGLIYNIKNLVEMKRRENNNGDIYSV